MRDIFLAPLLSLYSRAFYRRMIYSSLSRGLLYLLYLAVLAAFFLTLAFHISLIPKGNDLIDWLQRELPEIKLTRKGAQANVEQPFYLKHPQFGTILAIDTHKDALPEEEAGQIPIYITKTKVYVRQQSRQELRVYNLAPPSGQADWEDFTLTGDLLKSFYRRAVPFLYLFVFIFSFLIYFLWKFLAALFYSLLGLILNLFRNPKLKYENILNVTLFALTPASWLQGSYLIFPNPVSANFWLALLLTTVYLGIGILATAEKTEPRS